MASILVVNDIPGTGRIGWFNPILAVLNAAGYEVTLLPTVYLAHHTGRWPVYRRELGCSLFSLFNGLATGQDSGNRDRIFWQCQPDSAILLTGTNITNRHYHGGGPLSWEITWPVVYRLDLIHVTAMQNWLP